MKFGARLKELRVRKGLSQEQLSFRAGIDRSYISDVERGLRNIAIVNIYKLAEALEVPPYLLMLESNNLFERWDISVEELDLSISGNPSLRGFLNGYLAEQKIRNLFANDRRITRLVKFDDHDRKNKHDLVVTYKGRDISIEIKSLQTKTVKDSSAPGIEKQASFQCDASDKRTVILADGTAVETTCLKYGEFDVLAVNLFAFNNKWEYAFALNRDLPATSSKKYSPEIQQQLIKSLIPITYPIQFPFVSNPFELFDRLAAK